VGEIVKNIGHSRGVKKYLKREGGKEILSAQQGRDIIILP